MRLKKPRVSLRPTILDDDDELTKTLPPVCSQPHTTSKGRE